MEKNCDKYRLFILMLFICCSFYNIRPIKSQSLPESAVQQKPAGQLEINKNALLEGKDETIRIAAASLILSDPSTEARQFILDILKSDKNKSARIVICKAISRSRTQKTEYPNKLDLIAPLISIISSSEDSSEVRQAAEALLIFGYNDISAQIEKMATDASVPIKSRLNAIYVLQIQPDMKAAIMLISLVDDTDKQVSSEAEKALQAVGIPIAKDSATRKQIIKDLEEKGKDKFLQDWLIRQEIERKKLEDKVSIWREKYLASLDKLYAQITDTAEKGKFLSAYMSDAEPQVRLWSIDKAHKSWIGTGTSTIGTEVKEALSKLIADPDRDVRLKTAQLPASISEGAWTIPLAEQYKNEQDSEVKLALFDALGWSAYYGSLSNAPVKISPDTRRQILLWAEEYIADPDSKKAVKGVDCFRKLLEQDGLEPQDVEFYFTLLVQKYTDQNNDDVLNTQILSAMAKLCAASFYKDKAVALFRPLFETSLKNPADGVRLAAVEGLINIDKTAALKLLKNDFINDKNTAIREKIIELADAVGTKEDLNWLTEKLAQGSESKPAWQAALKILKRSDSNTIYEWIEKLDTKNTDGKLTDEQMLLLLEAAESKITAEKNTKMLRDIQLRLSKIYISNSNFERAAKCLGALLASETTVSGKDARSAELLLVYLRWPNLEQAVQLLTNKLLEKDLDGNNPIIASIDNYLSTSPNGPDPNSVLEILKKIPASDKPKWNEQLQKWSAQFLRPAKT